jgi:hypothetical protein
VILKFLLTQIKSTCSISEIGTEDQEGEVMLRTTGFKNNYEVMSMVSMTHFNGRPETERGHSGIKNIFREEEESERAISICNQE